jgi:hypothetical protein
MIPIFGGALAQIATRAKFTDPALMARSFGVVSAGMKPALHITAIGTVQRRVLNLMLGLIEDGKTRKLQRGL